MHRAGRVLIMNARMEDYYADRLSAEKLRRCYEVAPPRVQQYLRAELDFALEFIRSGDAVLDLGCGYGRTLPDLAARAGSVTAVDNAPASIALARKTVAGLANVEVREMDAAALRFAADRFNVVLCLQNGISAFHRDPGTLLSEALRVCRPGGVALFSTYAEKFSGRIACNGSSCSRAPGSWARSTGSARATVSSPARTASPPPLSPKTSSASWPQACPPLSP